MVRNGGRRFREQIRDEIRLSVSIGIGANKMVAKAATREAKPGRQVLVAAGNERPFWQPRRSRMLARKWGRAWSPRLDRLNVHRVGEVADMPVSRLTRTVRQSRKPAARAIARHRPPRRRAARAATGRQPLHQLRAAGRRPGVPAGHARLSRGTRRRLNALHDQATRGFQVIIRYGDYQSDRGRGTFRIPVDSERELKEAAQNVGNALPRRLPLRLLGIELTPLSPPRSKPLSSAMPTTSTTPDNLQRRHSQAFRFHVAAERLRTSLGAPPRPRPGNFKMRTWVLDTVTG